MIVAKTRKASFGGLLAHKLKQWQNRTREPIVEFALRAGVGRATLYRLRRGKDLPTLTTLRKLARELQCPVEELVN